MSDEPMREETRAQFASRLEVAVREALGTDALPNPEGWQLAGVKMVAMRGGDARRDENLDPALEFTLPDRTLTVAVLFTDPQREAFRRTPRYDILYLTGKEDPEAATYKASSDMLERLAAWVDAWDRGVPVTPPAPQSSMAGPGAPGAPAKGADGPEPASDGPSPGETRAQFSAQLAEAVREALGTHALPNPDGWRLGSVKVAAMRGETTVVESSAATALTFELDDRTLTVAVLPTDPSKEAFRRTPRYDILYRAGEGVIDGPADRMNHELLERFANWVDAWDRGVPASEEPAPNEVKARFASELEEAVRQALGTGALSNPDGWRLGSVKMVAARGETSLAEESAAAALVFELGDRTLTVAVVPTDPDKTAFLRTPRYDILYLAASNKEGAGDDAYEASSDMLERFAAWADAWDRGVTVAALPARPARGGSAGAQPDGADAPVSAEPSPGEDKARFAAELEGAVREALGSDALPNPDGWRLSGVRMVATRGNDALPDTTDDPALVFELAERTLSVAVLPTDPNRTAFRRTPRYDILYLAGEGGSDDPAVYEENSDLLERLAAWIDAWDRGVTDPPPPAEPSPAPVEAPPTDGAPSLEEGKARFAARLAEAVREALGTDALPNPDGWRLGDVRMVATRGNDALPDASDDPALVFELPDRKVTIAVLPSDPHRTAFRRTPRYDILYVAEAGASDVDVYEANTDLLERFAAWVDAWDRSEVPEPPPAEPPAGA